MLWCSASGLSRASERVGCMRRVTRCSSTPHLATSCADLPLGLAPRCHGWVSCHDCATGAANNARGPIRDCKALAQPPTNPFPPVLLPPRGCACRHGPVRLCVAGQPQRRRQPTTGAGCARCGPLLRTRCLRPQQPQQVLGGACACARAGGGWPGARAGRAGPASALGGWKECVLGEGREARRMGRGTPARRAHSEVGFRVWSASKRPFSGA